MDTDIGDNIDLSDLQPIEHSETRLSEIMDVIEKLQNNSGGSMGGAGAQSMDPTHQPMVGYNGNALLQQQQQQSQQQQHQQHPQQQSNAKNIRRKVKITEQPAGKALRFRYECEGRSAGSIPGVNSTPENKTFPTIEIVGYKGRAVVVVSCVTKDPPYRPHPHNLVGKEGCKKGVCTVEINSETMRAVFSNLGIQCVKKKDIEAALRAREDIRVDPFKTGFSHKFQPSSIDLNSVRLCFQVFLESDVKGRFTVPLTPVVSDPIFDKKAMSDLVICRLCSCSSTVYGGKEIILLCEKVAKEDISVRFFEEHNGHVVWEAFGDFQHTDVHKQTAITFRTPRYRTMEIDQPAKVFIQLRRPSDGATSEPLPFDFLPLESDPAVLKRKRQKLGNDANMHFIKQFQAQELQNQQHHQQQHSQHQGDHPDGLAVNAMNFLGVLPNPAIKAEPRDTSPLPYGIYGNAYRMPDQTPSPQPVSPSHTYNHNPSGTTSPYNLGAGAAGGTTGAGGNGNMISPTHQYGMAGGGGAAGGVNGSSLDYDTYHQQQHTGTMHGFNHMQSPPSHTTHQWPGAADIKQSMPNNNNLNNYNVNNILTKTAAPPAVASSAQSNNTQQPWNLPSGSMNSNNYINHLMANTQHNQHHHHQQNHNDAVGPAAGVPTAAPVTNANEAPPVDSLNDLYNMDSEQYVHLNSEDREQLMHLNSEDLSNLVIS